MASEVARNRAEVLERLAADLRKGSATDRYGDKRLGDVLEFLFWETRSELDPEGIQTLRRLGVPSANLPRRAAVSSRR